MQIEFTRSIDPVGKSEVVPESVERIQFSIDNFGRQMMKVVVNERDKTVYVYTENEEGKWVITNHIDIYTLYKYLTK